MNCKTTKAIPPDSYVRQRSASERSADPKLAYLLDNKASVWANKPNGFPVVDVRSNRAKWVRDWDKGVEKVSNSAMDVFLKMASEKEDDNTYLSIKLSRSDRDTLRTNRYRLELNHRSIAHQIRSSFGNPGLAICTPKDWFNIITPEQRRDALNKGMEDACWCSRLGQDARALCPEIASTAMLNRKGLALFDFYDRYVDMALATEEDATKKDIVDSEWWCSARSMVKDMEVEPECMHENFEFVFELYTCYRQDFIDQFVLRSVLVIWEACNEYMMQNKTSVPRLIWNAGAPGVLEIKDMRKELKNRDRLSQLCEYCDRSPEDVGDDARFLICSACKRQLNFEYYYCSKECQKSDWAQHKVHCGTNKVSKSRAEGVPEYKPSLALILQLNTLGKYPEADYLLFRINDSIAFNASFSHDEEKRALFKEKLTRVATDADRDGIDVVAKCLVDAVAGWPHSTKCKLTRENVIRQLTEEYEVDVKTRLEEAEADLAASGDEDRYKGMTITPLPGTMAKLANRSV